MISFLVLLLKSHLTQINKTLHLRPKNIHHLYINPLLLITINMIIISFLLDFFVLNLLKIIEQKCSNTLKTMKYTERIFPHFSGMQQFLHKVFFSIWNRIKVRDNLIIKWMKMLMMKMERNTIVWEKRIFTDNMKKLI